MSCFAPLGESSQEQVLLQNNSIRKSIKLIRGAKEVQGPPCCRCTEFEHNAQCTSKVARFLLISRSALQPPTYGFSFGVVLQRKTQFHSISLDFLVIRLQAELCLADAKVQPVLLLQQRFLKLHAALCQLQWIFCPKARLCLLCFFVVLVGFFVSGSGWSGIDGSGKQLRMIQLMSANPKPAKKPPMK